MIDERGMSLAEVVIVLLLASMVITVAVTYALPWLGREEMRSAVYQIQTHFQLARVHAISRNRSCRFTVDGATGRVQVLDLNDPAVSTDDIVLADYTLPSTVKFESPDASTPITLTTLSGSSYGATFASDGRVTAGAGQVVLHGGERYDRVLLYGAGGVRTEHWDGGTWSAGS